MLIHGLANAPKADRDALLHSMAESNKLFKGAILAENETSHPAFNALCGFTPSWIQPWIQTLSLARPLLSDDLLESMKDYDPVEAIAESLDPKW